VRLIDFTGARYWRPEEITQIAYTPESGGPEAFGGVRAVGPAYDVHGFGAVAYFLVTGAYPRVEASASAPNEAPPPPWSVLRRHPMLEQVPALRDYLHLPLADHPGHRPSTLELPDWTARLAELVRSCNLPDVGVDWSEPLPPARRNGAVGHAVVAGTETGTFERIERLERELVELRSAVGAAVARTVQQSTAPAAWAERGQPPGATRAATQRNEQPVAASDRGGPTERGGRSSVTTDRAGEPPTVMDRGWQSAPSTGSPSRETGAQPISVPVGPARQDPAQLVRGRAAVAQPAKRFDNADPVVDPLTDPASRPWHGPTGEGVGILTKGWQFTAVGGAFAFLSWALWAASNHGNLTTPLTAFIVVLVVAGGVFALTRLLGRLILVQKMGRTRRTARVAHALTGLFLLAAGVAYLRQTSWVIDLLNWLNGRG
jgi:hypothetical protein